jgi:hypothetical protein
MAEVSMKTDADSNFGQWESVSVGTITGGIPSRGSDAATGNGHDAGRRGGGCASR